MLTGTLVRLEPLVTADAATLARWDEEVDVARTHQSGIAVPASVERHAAWIDSDNASSSTHAFGVVRIADATLIGRAALSGISWQHGHAEVGIHLEQAAHGQGHGTEAMTLLLRFAFDELNLHRLGIGVFSTNDGAIRLYERLGFQHEGRAVGWGRRDGQRFDLVHMGLLEPDWRSA